MQDNKPKTLKYLSTIAIDKYNIIDNIEHIDIKNECLKVIKKDKIKKENEIRQNIRDILNEIKRLDQITEIAHDRCYYYEPYHDKIKDIRDNSIYDYYFLYYYIKTYLGNANDDEFDRYSNPMCKMIKEYKNFFSNQSNNSRLNTKICIFSKLINDYHKYNDDDYSNDDNNDEDSSNDEDNDKDYLNNKDSQNDDNSKEDSQNEDHSESEEDNSNEDSKNSEYSEDPEDLDDFVDWVLKRDDKLYKYFKIAHTNNYTKILLKLSKYKEYLVEMSQLYNDCETLQKILFLYYEDDDHMYYNIYNRYFQYNKYRYYNIKFIYKNKPKYIMHKELLSKVLLVL